MYSNFKYYKEIYSDLDLMCRKLPRLSGREERPGPPYSYFGGSSRSSLSLGITRYL